MRSARQQSWIASVVLSAFVATSCGGAAPAPRSQAQGASPASLPPANPHAGSAPQSATPATSPAGTPAALESAVGAEASRLGGRPDALLARVANGVRYEVYAGAFRGAAATLADGAGNDVDKALLLRGLLRASNSAATVRFATCTLPSTQVDRLIAGAEHAYRPPVMMAALASRAAATVSNARTRNLLTYIGRTWAGIGAQNRAESQALLADLQRTHAPVGPLSSADLRGIVASHTWLQLQAGTGWVDLDPSLPDAKVGATLCSAQSIAADLPAAAYDTVAVRVRVERRHHGAIESQTAVEGSWRTADLARASLTFAFAESSGLRPPAPAPPAPKGLVGYTPLLRAGDRILAGSPLYVPSHAKPAGSTVAGALGGVLGAFGGPPAPASTTPPPDVPEPVGMWLEVTVNSPGLAPIVAEGTVFDRVGYADRAANRVPSAQLAPLDNGKGKYLPFGAVWNVAVSAGTATAGAGDGGRIDPRSFEPANLIRGIGAMQRAYYAMRRAMFAEADGAQARPVFNVRPGVSFFGVAWRDAANQPSSATASVLLDVASDHAIPEGGGQAEAVLWATSALMAERFVAGGQELLATAARGGDVSSVSTTDVFAVFNAARRANVGTTLVRSARDIGPAVPSDAKARLAKALADDTVAALVPAAPVAVAGGDRVGWWLLGRDGSVRDQMDTGLHQDEVPGEALEDKEAAEEAPQFRKVGCVTRLAIVAVAAIGFALSPAGPEGAEAAASLAEAARAAQEAQEFEDEMVEIAEGSGETCPPAIILPK